MKFFIMDQTGHTTLEFTAEQKAEAEAAFKALIGDGKIAATRKAGGTEPLVKIGSFDEVQDDIVIVPHRVGG